MEGLNIGGNFASAFLSFPAYLVTVQKTGRLNVYKWDSVSKFTLQMVRICAKIVLLQLLNKHHQKKVLPSSFYWSGHT